MLISLSIRVELYIINVMYNYASIIMLPYFANTKTNVLTLWLYLRPYVTMSVLCFHLQMKLRKWLIPQRNTLFIIVY